MKNCPECGTPLMGGWCPKCHPGDKGQMAGYRIWAIGKIVWYVFWLMVLVGFVVFAIWAC